MGDVRLIIVRHGETGANREGIIQGHSQYPINEMGRRQATEAGKALASEIGQLDAAWTSDLSRCAETAEIILKTAGAKITDAKGLRKDELLRERCFGTAEKRPASEFLREAHANYKSQGVDAAWMYTPVGGESIEEMAERAAIFFENLCHDLRGLFRSSNNRKRMTAMLVAHGGYIKELLEHLADNLQCSFPNKAYTLISPNTGITEINLRFGDCEDMKLVDLTCTVLHQKDHLRELGDIGLPSGVWGNMKRST